jgi:antitoxin FitA
MARVLIRELDDDIVAKLKAQARNHGRSLEAELRGILERAASADLVEARSLAAKLRRRLSGHIHSDSVASIAEDRAR